MEKIIDVSAYQLMEINGVGLKDKIVEFLVSLVIMTD